MRISLTDAGKRFNREWIFRHLTITLEGGTALAITGPNGSGKSTLLQCIGGMMQPSAGTIHFERDGHNIPSDHTHRQVAFCAPYQEVVEELTLSEFLAFHTRFKPLLPGCTLSQVISEIGLEAAAGKQIRYFSSGMKQRVKLAQALFSDAPVLLLDEPCSNLDAAGIALYHHLIDRYTAGRLVLVCSNDEVEYRFCTERISIMDYKQ